MTSVRHSESQAIADFVADTQVRIEMVMKEKRCTRAALARRLGLSRSRVTQMFGQHPNMTIQTLARVFHALGEEPEITSPAIRKLLGPHDGLGSGAFDVAGLLDSSVAGGLAPVDDEGDEDAAECASLLERMAEEASDDDRLEECVEDQMALAA